MARKGSVWTQKIEPDKAYDFDVLGGRSTGDHKNDMLYRKATQYLAVPDENGHATYKIPLGVKDGASVDCSRYSHDRYKVRVASLSVDSVVCAKTNETRTARIRVLAISGDTPPTLDVEVWVPQGVS